MTKQVCFKITVSIYFCIISLFYLFYFQEWDETGYSGEIKKFYKTI